jgi:multiple sugar transport system permease protein
MLKLRSMKPRRRRLESRRLTVVDSIKAPGMVSVRRSSFSLGRRLLPLTFMAPAIAFIGFMFAYPLFANLQMSVQHVTVGSFLTGVSDYVGFDNYGDLFRDPLFLSSLQRTAIFTVFSIAGQMSIGMGLALFFWRAFPLSTALRALMLVPWLLPLVVSATIWQWMFDLDSGIINYVLTSLGVVPERIPWITSVSFAMVATVITNIWVGIPFSMAVFYSGLQSLPREILEAAELDGATKWQRFWRVILPMLGPLTGIVFTLSVTYTVKVFDLIFILTGGGPANATQTLATYAYQRSFRNFDWGHGAAIGNILILIALGFAYFYLRSYRQSLDKEGAD